MVGHGRGSVRQSRLNHGQGVCNALSVLGNESAMLLCQ
jgi:hypothetical protein